MKGSIRSRGKGTWELTVDLGRDTNGNRHRKLVTVKGTKAQADKKLRELLTSLDKGIPLNAMKMSFGDWLSRWMNEYVVPNTRQRSQ